MQLILRPAADGFFEEVVFPALELGVRDAGPALDHLRGHLACDHTLGLLELVGEHHGSGSFFGLEDPRWDEALYRLLFHAWELTDEGWVHTAPQPAFAAPWEDAFHVALMLEDGAYPYADAVQAEVYRRDFWDAPRADLGLSTLACGVWDPVPAFPPDQVLTGAGAGQYLPHLGLARADWAYRPLPVVLDWAARLPGNLSRLLDREAARLRPVSATDRHEVLEHWLGRAPAPLLAVVFSGLGPRSLEWIAELGRLAQLVRGAAERRRGLTAVISRQGSFGSS